MGIVLSPRTFCVTALGAGVVSLAWAGEAQAFVVNVGGVNYDVTTFTGSYNANTSRFTTAEMPWWGSSTLATSFATALSTGLGLPHGPGGQVGPIFAYLYLAQINSLVAEAWNSSIPGSDYASLGDTSSATYAVASLSASQPSSGTPVPVPLPLFGAAAAFGWSRRLRSRMVLNQTDLPG